MIDLPFPYRALLLAGIFAVLTLFHHDRSRWREYAFLFGASLVGGVFGVGNDLITSTISPAYFELAKGIDGGEGFNRGVMALGFQSGFVAGALAAAVCLYTNNAREGVPRLGYAVLCRFVVLPTAGAAVVGALAGALTTAIDPLPILRGLDVVVPVPAARPFVAVVGIHAGLYIGLLVGMIASIDRIRRYRRSNAVSVADSTDRDDINAAIQLVAADDSRATRRQSAAP